MLPAASSGGESANVESVGASQDTNPAVPDEVAAPAKPLRRPTSSFTLASLRAATKFKKAHAGAVAKIAGVVDGGMMI